MRRLVTQISDKRLVLSRNRAAYLPPLAGTAALAALALHLCFVRTPQTGFSPAQTQAGLHTFAVTMLVLCVSFLVMGLSSLRAQEWVFDWGIGLALLNGGFVCRFEDLRTVHLDRDYCGGLSSMSTSVLYLRTWAGVDIELAREGVYGVGKRELQEKAEAVCGFLGVALVMPDGYRPGLWEPAQDVPAPSPAAPRRWGDKRRGAGPMRARGAHPAVRASAGVLPMTDVDFAEELRLYRFRDWRFDPLFLYAGPADRADRRRLGVRVRYTVEDNSYPGSGRRISLQVVRFFDVSAASGHQDGWRVWVRNFLWQQVRWILEHEAREQFFYGETLPLDPHTATGGTLRNT